MAHRLQTPLPGLCCVLLLCFHAGQQAPDTGQLCMHMLETSRLH